MLLLFVVGDVLGAGIYALVGRVADRTGGAVWIAFLVALALAAVTAVSYAELVTKYPRAAGAALYVDRAFGREALTFVVAFAVMASGLASAAALSRAFAGDYLSAFADLPTAPVALAFLAALALVNARGIRESVALNVALTAIELAGLALVVAIGAAYLADGGGDPGRALEVSGDPNVALAILSGAGLAFFALIGFEDSVNLAEEVRDPRRAYPRALLGGLAIAGAVYVLVTAVASMAVPTPALVASDGPLLEVVRLGPLAIPTRVFSAIALFALANGALINMIMASRLLYGLARQGIVPPALGRVDRRRGTPTAAIAATSAVAAALALTGDLGQLADTTVLLLLAVFALVNACVLVLRRDPGEPGHFRAPAGLPVVGLAVCVALMATKDAATFARAGALLALGGALWLAGRLARRGA